MEEGRNKLKNEINELTKNCTNEELERILKDVLKEKATLELLLKKRVTA